MILEVKMTQKKKKEIEMVCFILNNVKIHTQK